MYAAVDQIINVLLSGDRAAVLAGQIPVTQAAAGTRAAAQADQLRRRITQADTASPRPTPPSPG